MFIMKKNLILSLIAGVLFVSLLSFTVIKKLSVHPASHPRAKTVTKKKCSNCTGGVSAVTLVRDAGGYITVSWTYTGNPAYYTYGGYYNTSVPPYNITTGTAYSTTLTISAGPNDAGRIGILAYCSDGTSTGETHGILWSHGVVEESF
jgi:hypothetical protein